MSSRERLTLAVALSVALGSAAVVPLYADLHWVLKAAGGIAAVAAAGLLTRRANVPGILQPLAGAAALLAYVAVVFARTTLAYGLLPTGETVTALNNLLQAGLTDIERLAPPVPSNQGLTLIAVLGVGAVAIVVDLVAVVLGRAAAAGLPLLVLFAVPSAVLPGGLGWIPFVFVAAGWLWLMLVEGGDRVSRWGTPLKTARPDRTARYDDTSLGRVGRRIGAAALGVAVVVPAMIPGLDARLLGGGGGGDGEGSGSRTTTTYNPITKLRDDLRLPRPRDILVYSPSKTPDYLRMTTLDRFNDAGWSSSRLSGNPKRDGVKGTLPRPNGLTSADSSEIKMQIQIRSLDAQWLPVPAVPSRVRVDGPWLYDEKSETVFGIRTGTKKLKKTYSVTAIQVRPDRALLAEGIDTGGDNDIRQYALDPGDEVTSYVRKLTEGIVSKAKNNYQRAALIQAYFDPKNGFTYSETSTVPGIESSSALEDFLKGKQGFCEQYASAMAAMLRIAGVPARVAVGFTAGQPQTDGTYKVTTDDAHAWPEAWFQGTGWIRFEPTPRRDGQTTVPAYTLANGSSTSGPEPGLGGPDLPDFAPGSDEESTSALQEKLDRLDNASPAIAEDETVAAPDRGRGPLVAIGLVALALATALPRVLHVLRRRRRWQVGGAPAGWAQVHDDAVDVGHVWRPADSPRAAAAALAQRRELDGTARAALGRIAVAAERVRYSRDGSADTAGLHDDAAVVRAALRASAGRATRVRSWLLPTSTLRWASSRLGTFVADVLDGFDNGWSALRRMVTRRPREA
ncbi:MAG: transglutaminase domain-containing protein [Frankiaceae bacterium]|nr:transglutaminase domain-containing protein [Frankiaceae bacterium]